MKNKILQEFLNSNLKIKSQIKLEEYIDYCIINRQVSKIKYKTELHHILPKSLFPKNKDIRKNRWNGSHLLFEHHYIAHSILIDAISSSPMFYAWDNMNKQNTKNGRIINPNIILGSKEYSRLKNNFHNHMNSEIIVNGIITTPLKIRMEKLHSKMRETDSEGVSNFRKASIKAATTQSMVNDDGFTIRQEANKKRLNTVLKNSKRYNIYDKNSNLLYENLIQKDVKMISQKLINSTKDKPLGSSPHSSSRLINSGKETLIGMYSLRI